MRRLKRQDLRGAVVGAAIVLLVGSACGGGDENVHALGEEAVAGYAETTSTGEPGTETTLGITVLAVRQGSHEELTEGGYEVDAEDQDTTPYFVDVRYENQGEGAITRNLDVGLEDSDGNLIQRTLIFDYGGEPFEPCVRITEGKLNPGESYESCSLFLVPEGVDVGKVNFLSDGGPDGESEFLYWEIE